MHFWLLKWGVAVIAARPAMEDGSDPWRTGRDGFSRSMMTGATSMPCLSPLLCRVYGLLGLE
ncbi:hypothetical protein C3920_03995 [Novacetimonas pomaceti]|uniref:Uncharacterized protein n=1 Tax=Novacetimonas pomaceti TaxID=2021998 RepID=A0ABX5P464_9PROT|nr:hypothetical protein C3920_03995 [Novacetimonas pomaceti]